MTNLKTAISIDKSTFKQMDALAKKLNTSRSRLFTIAARQFIEQNKNIELLKALNEAYDDAPETEPIVEQMRRKHRRMVKDQW
ncbi:MAG: ribbon-helix-helix domain-containing protein [Desulfobacteraceae bacterium]|nr:ribbon-helix-helix domain-containing protein [Desulfobacteraceae bacterium]